MIQDLSGSWYIKGTGESITRVDSPVPLMHHDPDRSWITDPDPDHPKGMQPRRSLCFIQRGILLAVGTKDSDWPVRNCILSKINKKSQHSRLVWDPSSFYTEAQEVSFVVLNKLSC